MPNVALEKFELDDLNDIAKTPMGLSRNRSWVTQVKIHYVINRAMAAQLFTKTVVKKRFNTTFVSGVKPFLYYCFSE